MTRPTRPTGRQRPGGAFGPARDETRNARIIEAVLDLIVESGYADLTMGAVAARAGVAKATVYRRWASREDLVADALESIMLPVAPAEATPAATLREDLVATLTYSSACLHPRERRFEFAGDALTYPQMADILSQVIGREISVDFISLEEVTQRSGPSAAFGDLFNDRVGYPARPHHAAAYGLSMTTFAQWAARQDWSTVTA